MDEEIALRHVGLVAKKIYDEELRALLDENNRGKESP
jgi:hypothetical protein